MDCPMYQKTKTTTEISTPVLRMVKSILDSRIKRKNEGAKTRDEEDYNKLTRPRLGELTR
jgi:hypothetical protein